MRLVQVLAISLLFIPIDAIAQPAALALPSHKGAMVLDLAGFSITQSSAKPRGSELGVRAHDKGHTELLAFLFLTPTQTAQTAATCLRSDIDQVKKDAKNPGAIDEKLNPQGNDSADSASILLRYPNGSQHLYKYGGSGDQCLSIEVYADRGTTLDVAAAGALLARQQYDPHYIPKAADKYVYAGVLYRTGQYAASVPIYADFLATAPNSREMLISRRVATDNMGMALGMTGKVDEARRVFQEAVAKDPDYPLYYYNLACADAEQGDAKNARIHLQQAFDRRANTIPGEPMPDPTKDDSILKLKGDQSFWTFVTALPKN